MTMENNTWVKFYRKTLDSSVWKNPNVWMVWSWCLLKANHQKVNVPFNGQDIELNSGEFITGRNKAVLEIPISEQTYRTCIKYLKSTSRITIKSTNRFSIIHIEKWEEYQSKLTSRITNKLTNHQPATNQPLTTDKNDKNYKNDKNTMQPMVADPINPLIELFSRVNPSYKRLYSDTTQRSCLKRLLDLMGEEKLRGAIKSLEGINKMEFSPQIFTPYELEKKMGKLIAFIQKQQLKTNITIKI